MFGRSNCGAVINLAWSTYKQRLPSNNQVMDCPSNGIKGLSMRNTCYQIFRSFCCNVLFSKVLQPCSPPDKVLSRDSLKAGL